MELLGAFYRIENDFHLSIQSPLVRRDALADGTDRKMPLRARSKTSMRRWKKDGHTKEIRGRGKGDQRCEMTGGMKEGEGARERKRDSIQSAEGH